MIAPRPNIILFMADQLTASMLGAYGHPHVRTPHIDSLARRGVRFDAAYSNCPLCAPARAALMSGQYASRSGSFDNGTCFPADVPTFAHMLRLAGYEVVLSGKMHFVGPDQLHGIEKRLTTDIYPADYVWCPDWDEEKDRDPAAGKGNFVASAGEVGWTEQLNYDEEVHFQALNYLRNRRCDTQHQKKPLRPFCLIVSYTHPHTPFEITGKYAKMYRELEYEATVSEADAKPVEMEMDRWVRRFEGVPESSQADLAALARMQNAYYGMISYIDDKLGELLQCMEALDLNDETAVIFTSDHGEMLGERGFVEKRLFYERSARVPLIASYPGEWAEDHSVKMPVSLLDLFPTFAEFVGKRPPIPLEGRSLLPVLHGGEEDGERMVFSEYHGEGVEAPCFMVRQGNFKYSMVHGGGAQLFDLSSDPLELHNLIQDSGHADLVGRLHAAILQTFNPEAIEREVRASQKACRFIHRAMQVEPRTHWDFAPDYPAHKRYCRE